MALERAHDRRIVGIASACTGVDDDVDSGQLMVVVAKRFPNQALQVVPTDRITDDAGSNGESQARAGTVVDANENCEEGIGDRSPCETSRILVDAIEVRFVMETLCRSERPGDRLQVALQ